MSFEKEMGLMTETELEQISEYKIDEDSVIDVVSAGDNAGAAAGAVAGLAGL